MNAVKSQPTEAAAASPPSAASGKLTILGILLLAVAAAAISWWFRYSTTHRATAFWGPDARLIRDSQRVELLEIRPLSELPQGAAKEVADDDLNPSYAVVSRREATNVHGILHLRSALLDNNSFIWPAREVLIQPKWKWELRFEYEKNRIYIVFNEDCTQAERSSDFDGTVVSTQPIAAGLREMFAEIGGESAAMR